MEETAGLSKLAMRRLQKEMRDREANPLAGISLSPVGDDMSVLHGNIELLGDGVYKGIVLHVMLELPATYPSKAPALYFRSHIDYSNGAQMHVPGKGISVCLNLLSNFAQYHGEWGQEASGWSPANTLDTVMIQIQGSLTDMLSSHSASVEAARKSAAELKCSCGHAPGNTFPPLPVPRPAPSDAEKPQDFEMLYHELLKQVQVLRGKANAYDALVESFERLRVGGTSSACNSAQPTVEIQQQVIAKPQPSFKHLQCFGSGSVFGDDETEIFGFGVTVLNGGSLSTQCELLSKMAFDGGIRKTSTNDAIDFVLPIFINNAHFGNAKGFFRETISLLYTAYRNKMRQGAGVPQKLVELQALEILCSLMNNAVLKTSEQGCTHDRFIHGYFAMLRLVKWLAGSFPTVSKFADDKMERFRKGERTKTAVPNLGDFLVLLHASKQYSWQDISAEFLEEVDARNVRWFTNTKLQSDRHMDGAIRERETFVEAAISRKIVCFQVEFVRLARDCDLSSFVDLDVTPDLVAALKDIAKTVEKHANWNDYRKFLRLDTKEPRARELERAVTLSIERGYHGGGAKGGGRGKRR